MTVPAGELARVRRVENNGYLLYLETLRGTIATFNLNAPLQVEDGDVVLVYEASIERVPDELWPHEDPWVAVVRLKLEDLTVLDMSGQLRVVPSNDSGYDVGNTVLATSQSGVVRRLHPDPVRTWDIGSVDEGTLARFKSPTSQEPLSFDDFGGLPSVVDRAYELIEVPLKHRGKLQKIKARPIKGVLFTGDPGTGKTMLARIIADRSGATLYEIRGPEFVSKWVGESEQVLRLIFDDAKRKSRSIIFFDEIDSVAPQRDEGAHEASKRVVAQLLTLMDGFAPHHNVMVVATTNRPEDIDQALLRPGRFDWEIEFPKPGYDDRDKILRVSARKLNLEGPLPWATVARDTEGWTGADLVAIWSEAALVAARDERDAIMAEDFYEGFRRVGEQKRIAARRKRLVEASR
jgi:transitional endoplasmic reticulum ATPase